MPAEKDAQQDTAIVIVCTTLTCHNKSGKTLRRTCVEVRTCEKGAKNPIIELILWEQILINFIVLTETKRGIVSTTV